MTEQLQSGAEIAFFDVETTIPMKPGQGFALLEFGAILVCPRKLIEHENYSTLICPKDLSLISAKSERCNGISRAAVSAAPSFADVADKVFDLLNERIWAGHNILRFDIPRIREAFAEVNRPPPEPKGVIDSLALLTERFGRRAGNMKMATLATYFGLGEQTHRSLDDVRMNLEVLKYCATVLFLESSLPEILVSDSWVSPSTSTRKRSGGRVLPVELKTPSSDPTPGGRILDLPEPSTPITDSFDMKRLSEDLMAVAIKEDNAIDERPATEALDISHLPIASESLSSSSEFVSPDEVSDSSITASSIPFYGGIRRVQLLHKGLRLKLFCTQLKVRFGISTKFLDQGGRPRLSFVVGVPPTLCQVLDACDSHAQSLFFVESGSLSDWRPLVTRKNGYWNFPTVRLHIPTVVIGNVAKYGSDIFQKEDSSGSEQKLAFNKFDPAELESLFIPGTLVDAFFSLDQYDIQQNAGIRLVADKLILHSP